MTRQLTVIEYKARDSTDWEIFDTEFNHEEGEKYLAALQNEAIEEHSGMIIRVVKYVPEVV